ncbi:hypothetical protein [Salipiger abyssi]|uniref:hypothetical protein n=1 Tax=Salipiger abyssi TaxID=1250539 RepID=UPI004059ADBE
MSNRIAFPFLTLDNSSVDFRGWETGFPGEPLYPAGEALENWDYARKIMVRGKLNIDVAAAASALDLLLDELRLVVVLKAGTGLGRFPRRTWVLQRVHLDPTSAMPLELQAEIEGGMLSGRLLLRLEVLLDGAPVASGALSPRFSAARLWKDEHDIALEDGGGNRFPIEIVDFSQVFPGQSQMEAPWFLRWQPGLLHVDFVGGIRLFINLRHATIADRVAEGDPSTLQAILADVINQMIRTVLAEDTSEDDLAEADEGTVGYQIRAWLDLAWPSTSLNVVRATWRDRPGEFHARILAIADLGEAE